VNVTAALNRTRSGPKAARYYWDDDSAGMSQARLQVRARKPLRHSV
jgi:hypothetical protein